MSVPADIRPRLRPGPALLVSVAAVLLAFAVGAVLIALLGVPVGDAVAAFAEGAWGSPYALAASGNRALVLMLALAEILARSGERIGCPGIMEPVSARNAAERLAAAIMHAPLTSGLPDTRMIRGASDIVLIGDFLDDADRVMERIAPLARRGLRGHVVEIADPAEETFPYTGRTEFSDPETGEKLTSGRAETLRAGA